MVGEMMFTNEEETDMQDGSNVERVEKVVDQGTKQYVERWCKKIKAAKKEYEEDFKRMREDMQLARHGADKKWVKSDNFTVPIVARYINQAVASLYARNPTVIAERRKTLDYVQWDGDPATLQTSMQSIMTAMQPQPGMMPQPPSPEALAVVQEVEAVKRQHQMIDKIGETLKVLADYFTNEQRPRFKPLAKKLVRHSKTCGVAYIMLGFQREFAQMSPDETAELSDYRHQLSELQVRMQDYVDNEMSPDQEYRKKELESLIEQYSLKENQIVREGPVFMFPKATEIIVDPDCTDLCGFVGAGWIAREYHKSPDDIQRIFNVDLKNKFTTYRHKGGGEMEEYKSTDSRNSDDGDEKTGKVCVWEVQNKDLKQTFTIVDGHDDFLVAPKEPDYWMEDFWNVFTLKSNDTEDDELYPLSDVFHLRHTQAEYNRSREGRRLHREANKPKYITKVGMLSKNDKTKFQSHPTNALIELEGGFQAGDDPSQMVTAFRPAPIDPALYETNSEMEDILRTVGAQEANLGGMSGGTATESSIAENGRMTTLSSDVDDLDEFLTDVFSALGQLMLNELSPETVREIAGPGSVWPDMDRETISKQLYLTVKAGSSGRPNKAAELANLERGTPQLLQLPGHDPFALGKSLGERYADLLEIDIKDAVAHGMPSINAINSQMGSAQPVTDVPEQQGGQGGDNAAQPAERQPGPQPAYEQPAPGGTI